MCAFQVGFDMHGFSCWCMVLFLSMAWFFQAMKVIFGLEFPFSRCHGVGMFIWVLSFGFLDGLPNLW